jgi:hypothetical protein
VTHAASGAPPQPAGLLARAPRIATWIVAFIVGAVYGLAGTIAHAYRLGWLPLGLVLAIIGCGALLAAVRLLTADRWAALAAGLGMMFATVVFSGRGPGGSVIVPQTELAIAWTISVPILVVAVTVWPNPRFRPVRADATAPGDLG